MAKETALPKPIRLAMPPFQEKAEALLAQIENGK
jgi:hypothetical protein